MVDLIEFIFIEKIKAEVSGSLLLVYLFIYLFDQ